MEVALDDEVDEQLAAIEVNIDKGDLQRNLIRSVTTFLLNLTPYLSQD